jgi:hypothetical protein
MAVEVVDFDAIGPTDLKRWETEFGFRQDRNGEDWPLLMKIN